MTDLILTGGTVVNETASDLADVAITGGRVSAIGKPGSLGEAAEVVNVTGLHLIPGVIDMHVHFREPGYTHKEDWETGTRAAARPAHVLGHQAALRHQEVPARLQGAIEAERHHLGLLAAWWLWRVSLLLLPGALSRRAPR